MKKARFTESQIIKIIKEYESGIDAQSVCRNHGISKATLYNWRKKYSGMEVSQLKRLKELEAENRKLKQMYADQSLDNLRLSDLLGQKLSSPARKKNEQNTCCPHIPSASAGRVD